MKFLLPLVVLFTLKAYGNDGYAAISAGGIVFQKSREIKMKSEILKISSKSIEVEYTFVNESKKDIIGTVAFPMPAITC